MASLNMDGIDDLQRKLSRIETGMRGECMEQMLKAGGEVFVRSWQEKIRANNHISQKGNNQHMVDSVKVTNITLDLDGGTATVMPDGYDDRGVPQALKAWAINAGANHIKKDQFVKAAQQAAREEADKAMEAVLNDYIQRS